VLARFAAFVAFAAVKADQQQIANRAG